MSKNKQNHISEKELDQLLNKAFSNLDFNQTKNAEIMQSIANHTLNNKSIFAVIKNISLLNKILLPPAFVLITGAVIYFSSGNNYFQSNNAPKNTVAVLTQSDSLAAENKEKTEEENDITEKKIVRSDSGKTAIKTEAVENSTQIFFENKPDSAYENPNEKPIASVSLKKTEDSAYVFPILSEKEIKENHKQKKKMIELLMKFNKEKYVFVPMGTTVYKNKTVSLNSFYMQNAEVTNKEYRTFLFDLLIQNRKDEFLKAKPDQKQWLKEFNKDIFQFYVDFYFSHPAYDNHPIVNISREGAEMYCVWLSQETNKILTEKNKPLINDLRIPLDEEWFYAASDDNKDAVYPWPSTGVRDTYVSLWKNKMRTGNERGCFLANFCLQKYKGSLDSMDKCNPKGYKGAYTTAGFMLGTEIFTVNVYSYNMNKFGLYCMSGNVAEMVKVVVNYKAMEFRNGTKGGSWNSDAEHIKLNGEDEYADKINPSPLIGFRPVITFVPKK